ncbi:hypothetical protein ACW9UR_22510 [Halovulum sp. GXIMD14794]
MRVVAVFVMVLAGCASPAMQYQGVEPQVMRVGGYVFSVYAGTDEAQVIRTNFVPVPDRGEVLAAATVAAEQATGCRARKNGADGDAALVDVRLICPPSG